MRSNKMCPVAKELTVYLFPVKASLLQFEELKEKYHQDYIMKKEEVSELKPFSIVFRNIMLPQFDKHSIL